MRINLIWSSEVLVITTRRVHFYSEIELNKATAFDTAFSVCFCHTFCHGKCIIFQYFLLIKIRYTAWNIPPPLNTCAFIICWNYLGIKRRLGKTCSKIRNMLLLPKVTAIFSFKMSYLYTCVLLQVQYYLFQCEAERALMQYSSFKLV